MYKGNENLINNGQYLDVTIQDYWQWAYSNLLQNMQRGNFTEFIVKTALESAGIHSNDGLKKDLAPYDLNGPIIKSTGKQSRIEVKSAAKVQLWDIKHPDRLTFSIAPASVPDESGDYNDYAPKQRNNDLYVFAVYTATDRRCNVLDLTWWEFYVISTYKLESDEKFKQCKTISLQSVQSLSQRYLFDSLAEGIVSACNEIPSSFEHYTILRDQT